MASVRRTGATAAAALPAALAGALLVSAPFAGTTTAPLANSHTSAYTTVADVHHARAGHATSDKGLSFDVSPGSIATLVGAEMLLVGVGVGVIVMARRRHAEE